MGSTSSLVAARVKGIAVLATLVSVVSSLVLADVMIPPEFEWDYDRTWQDVAIVNDVLIVKGYQSYSRHVYAYELPALTPLWDRDGLAGAQLASHEGALLVLQTGGTIFRLDPGTGGTIFRIPGEPGDGSLRFAGRVLVKSVRNGLVAYGLEGGTEIWRLPDDCGLMSLQGGLYGRAAETCASGHGTRVLILGNGRSKRWGPQELAECYGCRCPEDRNLDGRPPSPPGPSLETTECMFGGPAEIRRGNQVIADEENLVLRGLDRDGRVTWESRSPGHFQDLTYLDPNRAVIQTDEGMRLVRVRDGIEIGRFEDSAAHRVLGVYAGKLVSKRIGSGYVKIHDLDTHRALAAIGGVNVANAFVGRGSPYLVLVDIPGKCWRIYRLGDRRSAKVITLLGTIQIAGD